MPRMVPPAPRDGRWLAYVSDESGRFEVYVTAFPSLQGRWQISTEGGGEVRWAPNGRELFWRTYDQLLAASVNTQAGFSASKPKVLFGDYMVGPPGIPAYDVAPDGQRFLMLQAAERAPEKTEMHVIVNWSARLASSSGSGIKQ
jgi:hypothetical protein